MSDEPYRVIGPGEPYVQSYWGTMPMSYSQQIDRTVTMTERPYGYDTPPPADDHENMVSKEQMYKRHKQRS
jgi:hypothetical protein